MAKAKASRPPEKPAAPVRSNGVASAGAAPGGPGAAPAVGRDHVTTLLMALLALSATAFIWTGPGLGRALDWRAFTGQTAGDRINLALTGIVWILTLVGLLGRIQARRTARELRAILAREELVRQRLEPGITEDQSGVKMRYVSAWLVLCLGITASVVVWHTQIIEQLVGDLSTLVVGGTITVMLALAVAANAINRMKARRLARDFRAALASERLALDTLGGVEVMISACLPTGERARFNDNFLRFVGRTEAQMQGRGWLEIVHEDDRQAVLELVAKPLSGTPRPRSHDVCVRHRDGKFVWIHETLSPRLNSKGELIEFIGTAIDITRHVENEAALDKQIGDMKADLDKARAELEETRGEFSKTKTSRNRFETGLNEAREEVKNLQQALSKAEGALARAQAEAAEKVKEAQTDARERVKAAEEDAEKRVRKVEETSAARITKAEEAAKAAKQEAAAEIRDRIKAVEEEAAARVRKAEENSTSRLARAEEIARSAKQESQAEIRERIKAIEEDAAAKVRKVEEGTAHQIERLEEAARTARQEAQQAAAENKKLTRAFETLQAELATLRHQGGDSREQVSRHIKETREAKSELADVQRSESQHRAKNERLTQRCAELEAQLAARDAKLAAALGQATEAGAAAAAEMEKRMRAASGEALAKQLRAQLGGMQRLTADLLSTALDGPVKDAAQSTAAAVRAMTDLVEQAVSGAAPCAESAASAATSFDLRRTAEGVRDMLAAQAEARAVKIEVECRNNVPALVHGDDLEIRTAMASLAGAALELLDEGTLTLRLAEDVNTGAHSTIRCELVHSNARVKNDALEAAVAIKSTDTDMPDAVKHPAPHQAAKAWRTLRRLGGQHGYLLPAEGGFTIWFTFTLGRPGASASFRMPAPAPAPAPARAAQAARQATPAPAERAEPASQGDATESAGPRPRMPQEFLNSSLGEVAELGVDSVRVFCNRPPKEGDIRISFDDVDLEKDLKTELLWCKKLGTRKHDVGLKFVGLTAEQQKKILQVAMQHRKVSTIAPEVNA